MLLFMKSLVALSAIILVIGLIKPKWICFWMKEPSRVVVSAIAMFLFMGAWTGIAKLTLKPKEPSKVEHRSLDERNELELDNR